MTDGSLRTTRRQMDGHPTVRLLGGVDAADWVVAGGSRCGAWLYGVGPCLLLLLSVREMREPALVLDGRLGCAAGFRLSWVFAGASTVWPVRRDS